MMKYRTKDGDMLDAIAWKHYGPRPGAVEALLEANPGLADQGPLLSPGQIVALPPLPDAVQEIQTVRLWD